MPEVPPDSVRKPTDPDEPDRTGDHVGSGSDSFGSAEKLAAGSVIAGKYKLLEAIGEGGMGAVWMAQQIEPVKRHVAVKLIRSGMDSKTVVARFEAERQALSMMDHPNIARVFDVGTTSTGRPFFVMELVKGTPITDFCDQRSSPRVSASNCSSPSATRSNTHIKRESSTATSNPRTYSLLCTTTNRFPR